MKKLAFLSIAALFLFSCGQQPKKQQKTQPEAKEVKNETVLSVDKLLEQAPDLIDKEVTVKGTVLHVCHHGGKRCFLMGSTKDFTIRINAGAKIDTFSQEQVGKELEIAGILKEALTEAEKHPGGHHNEETHEDTEETKEAHEIIEKNREKAKRIFFIDGKEIK